MTDTEILFDHPELKAHLQKILCVMLALTLIYLVTQNNDRSPNSDSNSAVFYHVTPLPAATVVFVDGLPPQPLIRIDQPLPDTNAGQSISAVVLTSRDRIFDVTLRTRSSDPDLQYQGTYYRSAELDLSPAVLTTRANIWMTGEYSATNTQGCFGDPVDGGQYQIATWFYPCGTIVEVKNPKTGQSTLAEVTDRGPNRKFQGTGWENDRIRQFGVDITPAVARAIGHSSGDVVAILPIRTHLPPRNIFVDLTQSPSFYTGIDPATGNFIAWKQ